ncbi:MAG: nuclear transport factor 2 family protein [Castellaniella sp.]|uniref:YybH family protein n=1 Tax=Castellaniella sp. TaxID=1955812 RepID=UPI002A36F316|nr:nuclear transport factor 2 family protein [Castellaniella sp.]MDY0309521.1 nuclear transport factor 2 family protein [Castellaniella sp.]
MFATPEEAEYAFYEAMRQGDAALMMRVWSDDEDAVCIHPGGLRILGPRAIRASWERVFANGPVNASPSQVKAVTGVMSAVHLLIERIRVNTPRGKDTLHFYATNLYQKGPEGWRMIVHHASPAPREAEMLDRPDPARTLH